MPYDYRHVPSNKSGEQWEVYNKNSGKIMGKFPSKKAALDQLAALYANVKNAVLRLVFGNAILRFVLRKNNDEPL